MGLSPFSDAAYNFAGGALDTASFGLASLPNADSCSLSYNLGIAATIVPGLLDGAGEAELAGLAGRRGASALTHEAEGGAKGTKGLKDQAADLVPLNHGKHRVTLRSEKQQLEIDLAGKDHAGIQTPHTKVSPRNTQAPEHLQPAYNTSNRSSTTRASTQEEIRAARKYLERQDR